MYCLTEEQIEFIRDDIRARGIRMVGLQQDLLDHICCVVEHNLETGGDFGSFYSQSIKTFYKTQLSEIEEETITLLTLKNYYVMKKIMIIVGGLSSLSLTVGLIFKFLHLAGASLFIFLGVIFLSLFFLPLLFLLKIKEKRQIKDKIIVGIGTLAGILVSLHVLFKIMHWPFANMLGIIALGMMLLLFLPVYFFTGIRQAETKVNTIVSSIFILYGGALLLTMIRSPKSSLQIYAANTVSILRSESILSQQQRQTGLILLKARPSVKVTGVEIISDCEKMKSFLLESETGSPKLQSKAQLISDADAADYLADSPQAQSRLEELMSKIRGYNMSLIDEFQPLPTIANFKNRKIAQALSDLIQIEMVVLQNQAAVALLE